MKIGFVGLGVMGEPMCANVIRKHDDSVFVFGHNAEHVNNLVKLGGVACDSYRAVAERADVIFSMVATADMSRAVFEEMKPVLDATKICIDMATIEPWISVEIAQRVKETGAQFLDAPVLRSKPDAIRGTLGILVGGDREVFEVIRPILSYMGTTVLYMGKNGSGLVMKVCHNALVAQIQNGVNETATLAASYGVDIRTYAEAVALGGGQNFYIESKVDALEEENYDVAFSLRNMTKDVGISLKLAEQSGLSMPGQENAMRILQEGMDAGYGDRDYCITMKIVQEDSKKPQTSGEPSA